MATIKNIIQTVFSSQGAGGTITDLNNLGRAQTRLGQSSASAGRSFASQSQGLGGLVAAYAGAAATTFALQQAYDKLAKSARATQTLEGLNTLAANAGANANKLLGSVRELTNNQLTIVEAAQQTNLALSAGFNSKQIEGLSSVALKASRALGRDLTDAMTRVTRGSAKMETELLDELGIYTKIEPATRAYAAAIGKNVTQLSEFERRQAFVNSVIAEGEKKFKAINTAIPTSAERIEAFGVKIIDLSTKVGSFLADVLAPLASFLTNNVVASFSIVGATMALVASKGISILRGGIESLTVKMINVAVSAENTARGMLGLETKVLAANNAIIALDASTLRLTQAEKQELITLQQTAGVRALSTAEMQRALAITNANAAALQAERAAAQANLIQAQANVDAARAESTAKWAVYNANKANTAALHEARVASGAYGAAVRANNAAIALNTPIVVANTAALAGQAAAQNAVTAATTGTAAKIGSGLASAIRGVAGFGAALSSIALTVFGFATTLFLIVTVVGLVASALLKMFGLEKQFTAWVGKLTSGIVGFFNDVEKRAKTKAINDFVNSTLNSIANADDKLRDLNSFTFRDKFLGVTIEVTKTKEDLINEVQQAIADAGKVGFGEAFMNAGVLDSLDSNSPAGRQISTAIGGTLGAGIGAAIAVALAPGSGGLSLAIYGAAVLAGTALGIKSGAAFADSFASETEALDYKLQNINTGAYITKYSTELKGLTQDQQKYALVAIDSLTKSYNGAELFNGEAKKALDLQVRTAIATLKVSDSIGVADKAATAMGKSVEDVYKNFDIAYDAVTGIGNVISGLPDSKTVTISVISDKDTQNTLDKLEQENKPTTIARKIFPNAQNAIISAGAGAGTIGGAGAAIGQVEAKISSVASILSGDYFTSFFKSAQDAAQEYKDFQSIILNSANGYDVLNSATVQLTDNQRNAIIALKSYGVSFEDLKDGIASTTEGTDTFVKKYIGLDATLSQAVLRSQSNYKTLFDRLRSGNITQEEFAQLNAAVASSITESNTTIEEYNKTNAERLTLDSAVSAAILFLSGKQQDSIRVNMEAVAAQEANLASLQKLKQGFLDTAAQIAFASKYAKDAMSTLDFSVALGSASSGVNAGNFVLEQLVAQTSAAKDYSTQLETLKTQLDKTTLSDSLKQEIASAADEDLAALQAIADKSDKLQVSNGKLQVSINNVWTDIDTLSAKALLGSEKYSKSLAASVEQAKQLLIESAKTVYSLGEERKQLDIKISNQRDSLELSKAENAKKASELEISKQLAVIENDTKAKERQIEFINQTLGIQKQLTDNSIKQRDIEISAIESKAALEEAAAQSSLARLKAQRQEQQALLDLQSKAYELRIASLEAQTDPAIAEASVRASDFTNIASVLSDSYNKQQELVALQTAQFELQIRGYRENYESQLAVIEAERKIAEDKVNSEIKVLQLQKKNALDEAYQIAREIAAQDKISKLRSDVLENEASLEAKKAQGDIEAINAQARITVQKAEIDKKQLAQNVALESEKATRAARQLQDQYTLLEKDSDVKAAFLKDYQALLDEQARLTSKPGTTVARVSAAQDFSARKTELANSIEAIQTAYESIRKDGIAAINAQRDAALASLLAERTNLQDRQKATEEYYRTKIELEKQSAAASRAALQVELNAQLQQYQSLADDLKAKQGEIVNINAAATEQQKQAYTDYINTIVAEFGKLQAKINDVAAAAAAQANSLRSLATTIAGDANARVFKAQDVEFAKQIGTIQNDISVKQSELNLLKAQEASAGSSGLSTQERMLTLKKQEIEFQASLNKIEAEGQERKLQYLVEQGKKAATLFENSDSAVGLAGSIAALAGVFVNQKQIIDLQKTQAEKAYKDELALIEIDRQLLEEDKKAKGAAASASAAVIAKEREILVEQQKQAQLELDRDINRQNAAIKQLETEKELQINQAQIDGIRAKSEVEANRTRLDTIEKEASIFSQFINELRPAIVESFREVLKSMGVTLEAAVGKFEDVDIGATLDFSSARAAIEETSSLANSIYGDVATKQGEIFNNINANSDLAISAAQTELDLLTKRRSDLEIIQKNELAAFDANAKAKAAGAAMEIAEIDKREKELRLRLANANAAYADAMDKATQDAAAAMQEFATAVVEKIGKYLVNQQTKKIEQAKVNESIINESLTATSEKLQEAQSKAGEALSKEIGLREELKSATENLIENQKAYIKSVSGREDSILESSKIYIESILEQKRKALDLSKTISQRLRLDDQVKSLEDRKISLEAALTDATEIRLKEENKLAEMQKIISVVTDIASGKLASFAQQIQTVAASASAMFSGGGNLGQAFMSAFGFDKIVSGFQAVTSSLMGAGATLNTASTNLAAASQSLAVTTSKVPPANPFYGAAAGKATAGAGAATTAASGFWGSIGGAISGGMTGFGIGSIIGALTNDPGMGSTIGGAIGGALAAGLSVAIPSLFASGTFLGGLTTAMSGVLGTLGFAASMAIPVLGAIAGAIIGRFFSKTPKASASGKLTEDGAIITSTSQTKVPGGTAKSLGEIGATALENFIDGLKAAGIAFKDVVYWSISLKKNSITGASLSFAGGDSFSMGSRGTSSSDIQATAQFYVDSFVQGLRKGSLVVDQTILNARDLQTAIDKFVTEDKSIKTVERLQYVLEYASKFSTLLNDIGQAVPTTMNEALTQITDGSQAAGAALAAQYTSLLKEASSVFGSNSDQYKQLNTRIQGNVLAQLGLVQASDKTIMSISEATENLNTGAISVANIIETVNGYTKAVIASGKSVEETANIISIATSVQLSDFVTSIAEGLTESIEVLKNPAKAAVGELLDIIESSAKRTDDLRGAADELIKRGKFEFVDQAVKNYTDSIELASLEIASYLSTLDIAQLQAVIADERVTDARTKSAAATRLAELEEVDRTTAIKNFVKISKDFNKTIAEITDSFSIPQFMQSATSVVEVMQMLGRSTVDSFSKDFSSLVNSIARGEDLVGNFERGISDLNSAYSSGTITATQYSEALDLLQSTTLDSLQVYNELKNAIKDAAQEIADTYTSLLDSLVSTADDIGSTLMDLLDTFQSKSTDVLKIYDNTLKGVAESGNEILDLKDTAASAYASATAAVQEFDKANKLSGRSSSEVRNQINDIQTQLNTLSAQPFDFSSFLNFGKLTSQQRALQVELNTLSAKEAERNKLLEAQTLARNDLAVAEATVLQLGDKLIDTRLKESELVQKIEAATVDFAKSQKDLADITELLATANFDLNQARFDEQDSVKETSRLLLELSGVAKQLNFEVSGLTSSFLDTITSAAENNAKIKYQAPEYDSTREELIKKAIDDTTAYYNSLVAVGAQITDLTDPFMNIAEPVQLLASELDIYSLMLTDRFKGFSTELIKYLDTDGLSVFYGENGKFAQFRDSLLRTLVVQGFEVLTATGGVLDGFNAKLGAITLAYTELETSGTTLNTTVSSLKDSFGELITVMGESSSGVIGAVQVLITDLEDASNYPSIALTTDSGIGYIINEFIKSVNDSNKYTAITIRKDQANTVGYLVDSYIKSINESKNYTNLLLSKTAGVGLLIDSFISGLNNSGNFTAPTVSKTAGTGSVVQSFITGLNSSTVFTAPTLTTTTAGSPGASIKGFISGLDTATVFSAPSLTTKTLGTVGASMAAFLLALDSTTGFSAPTISTTTAGTIGASMAEFLSSLDLATGFSAPALTTETVGTIGSEMAKFLLSLDDSTGFTAPSLTTTTAGTLGASMASFLSALDTATGFRVPSLTTGTAGTIGAGLAGFLSSLNTTTGFTSPTLTTSTSGTVGASMSGFLSALNTATGFTVPTLTLTGAVGTLGKSLASFISGIPSTTGFTVPTLTTDTTGTLGAGMAGFLSSLNTRTGFAAPTLTTSTAGTIGAGLAGFLTALNTTTGFTVPTLTLTGAVGTLGKSLSSYLASIDTNTGFTAPTLTLTGAVGTLGKTLASFLSGIPAVTGFTVPTLTTGTTGTVGAGLLGYLNSLDTKTGFAVPTLTLTGAVGTLGKTLASFLSGLPALTGFTVPTLTTSTTGTVGAGLLGYLNSLNTSTGFTVPTLTLTGAVGTFGKTVATFLSNIPGTTGFTVPALNTTTTGTVGKSMSDFLAGLNNSANFTVPTLSTTAGVGKSIQDYVTSIKDTLVPAIGGIADVFTDARVAKITSFKNAVTALDTAGASITNSEAILTAVSGIITNSATASTSITNVSAKFTALNTAIKPLLDTLSSTGAVTAKGTFTAIQEKITGMATAIQTAWDSVVFKVPTELTDGITLKTTISAETALSKADSDRLATIATNSSKYPKIKNVTYDTPGAFASGGFVEGPGSNTSDSIPARLSNGEYVIRASSVRSIGKDVLDGLNNTGNLTAAMAKQGRKGDSLLAHINPAEANMLMRAGGSGTINPKTGLLEFFNADAGAVGKVFRDQEVDLLSSMFANNYTIPGNTPSVGVGLVSSRRNEDSLNTNSNSVPGQVVSWNEPSGYDPRWGWSYTPRYLQTSGGPIQTMDQYRDHNLMLRDSMDLVNYSGKARGLNEAWLANSTVGSSGSTAVPYNTSGGAWYRPPSYLETYYETVYEYKQVKSPFYPYNTSYQMVSTQVPRTRWVTPMAQYYSQPYTAYTASPVDNTSKNALDVAYGPSGMSFNSSQLGRNNLADRGTKLLSGYSKAMSGVDSGSYTDRGIDKTLVGKYVDAMNTGDLGNFTDFYMLNNSLSKYAGKFPNSDPYAGGVGTQIPVPRSSGGLMRGRDSIPAMLEPGEFVLRKQAVDMMGLDKAIRLNSTGSIDGGDVEVEVNINNNGTAQTTVGTPEVRRVNGKIIVDIILEDLRNNGPINRQIRSIR